jgi:hypothetical protein
MEGTADSPRPVRKMRVIQKLEKPHTDADPIERDEVKAKDGDASEAKRVREIRRLDKDAALATYDTNLTDHPEPISAPAPEPEKDNRARLRDRLRSMRNQRTGRGMPDMPSGKEKKKLVKAYKSRGVNGVLGKMGIDDPELAKMVNGAVQSRMGSG